MVAAPRVVVSTESPEAASCDGRDNFFPLERDIDLGNLSCDAIGVPSEVDGRFVANWLLCTERELLSCDWLADEETEPW